MLRAVSFVVRVTTSYLLKILQYKNDETDHCSNMWKHYIPTKLVKHTLINPNVKLQVFPKFNDYHAKIKYFIYKS